MTDDNSGRQADIARAIELARRVEVGQEPLTPFDPAELLTTADAVAAFLAAAKASADPRNPSPPHPSPPRAGFFAPVTRRLCAVPTPYPL